MVGKQSGPEDLKRFTAVVKRNPNDIQARANILGYYCGIGTKTNAKIYSRHMCWFVENHPKHDVLLNATCMASYDYSSKWFDEVAAAWEKKVEENQLDNTILRHAAAFMSTRDLEKNLEYLQRAEKLCPRDVAVAHLLESSFRSLDRHSEANAQFIKALKLWFESTESYVFFEKLFHVTLADAVVDNIMTWSLESLRELAAICDGHEELERKKSGDDYVSKRGTIYNYSKHTAQAIYGVAALLDGDIEMAIRLLEDHLKARLLTDDPFKWSPNRAIYDAYSKFPEVLDHIRRLREKEHLLAANSDPVNRGEEEAHSVADTTQLSDTTTGQGGLYSEGANHSKTLIRVYDQWLDNADGNL